MFLLFQDKLLLCYLIIISVLIDYELLGSGTDHLLFSFGVWFRIQTHETLVPEINGKFLTYFDMVLVR